MNEKRTLELIDLSIDETTAPLNASYEYDPTPTSEERLKKINVLLNEAKQLQEENINQLKLF